MRVLTIALGLAAALVCAGCFTVGDDDDDDDDDGGRGGSAGSGATGGKGGSGGTGGTGGSPQCRMANADCTDDVGACCNGTTCVSDVNDETSAVCATNCLDNTNCASGCCVPLTNLTTAVCAPAEYCACISAGNSCLDNTGGCCADSICIDSAGSTVCAATCTDNSECNSGCCAPLTNSTTRVCSPVSFCEP